MIDGVPMKPRSLPVPIFVCALMLIASARSLHAQTERPTEFFAGYSYLEDPGNAVLAITTRDNQFRLGWTAGVAQPIGTWIALVGEASGHYKRKTSLDDDVHVSFHAFMGGARASARVGRLTEFAQLLAGATHASGSAFGIDAGVTAFSLQPGGGVDFPIASRLSARLELDYRWLRHSAEGREHASQFRAVAAIVYR
jgi:hypothetical protein